MHEEGAVRDVHLVAGGDTTEPHDVVLPVGAAEQEVADRAGDIEPPSGGVPVRHVHRGAEAEPAAATRHLDRDWQVAITVDRTARPA